LNNQYRGTSPRNIQGNTDYVFSAAKVPSHDPIAQHVEMSFLPAPPKQLYFSALQAPKTAVGGETTLADFRKVYQDAKAL
jgi:alpha-ketoglutarate-dependent taurine dioxygenase